MVSRSKRSGKQAFERKDRDIYAAQPPHPPPAPVAGKFQEYASEYLQYTELLEAFRQRREIRREQVATKGVLPRVVFDHPTKTVPVPGSSRAGYSEYAADNESYVYSSSTSRTPAAAPALVPDLTKVITKEVGEFVVKPKKEETKQAPSDPKAKVGKTASEKKAGAAVGASGAKALDKPSAPSAKKATSTPKTGKKPAGRQPASRLEKQLKKLQLEAALTSARTAKVRADVSYAKAVKATAPPSQSGNTSGETVAPVASAVRENARARRNRKRELRRKRRGLLLQRSNVAGPSA